MKNFSRKMSKKKSQQKQVKQAKVLDKNTLRDIEERRVAVQASLEKALGVSRDFYTPFFKKICKNTQLTAVLLGKTTPVNYTSYRKLKKGLDTLFSTFLRSMHRLFDSLNYRFHLAHEFDSIIRAVSHGKCVVMLENISKEDLCLYPESSHYFVHSTKDRYEYPYPTGEVSKEERKLLTEQSKDRANAFVEDEVKRFAKSYYPYVQKDSILELEDVSSIGHSSYAKFFSGNPICFSTFIRMINSFFRYSRRVFNRINRFEALERAIANGSSIVLKEVMYADLCEYDKKSHLFL